MMMALARFLAVVAFMAALLPPGREILEALVQDMPGVSQHTVVARSDADRVASLGLTGSLRRGVDEDVTAMGYKAASR